MTGIGSHYANELASIGVRTRDALMTTDAQIISAQIDDVTPNMVHKWQTSVQEGG